MTSLTDILLSRPLPDEWVQSLLFFTFVFHFLFVLFTVGTAILAFVYHIAGRWGDPALRGWDKELLESFFSYKSLAIVLGVLPIIIIQMGVTVPFLTGVNLMAPLWLFLIVALITALALYEWLERRKRERPWLFTVVVTLGLAILLYVPCTFVATLVAAEHPERWPRMVALGGQLTTSLAVHWLFRFLHVFGAAVVFTAAVFYIRRFPRDERKRRHLLAWVAGGLAFQFVIGVLLFGTVQPPPSMMTTGVLAIGILAAGLLILATQPLRRPTVMSSALLASLLAFVLVSMLLARQLLQVRVWIPMGDALRRTGAAYEVRLAEYRMDALALFEGTLAAPYDNETAVYMRSCKFCHGAVGNGFGEEADQLRVPPEDLTTLRMTESRLQQVLMHGVDGTAMPRINFYNEHEIHSLKLLLRGGVGLDVVVEPLARPVSEGAMASAREVYATTCAVCHGASGRVTRIGKRFRPPAAPLAEQTLAPERLFRLITEGYPGTMMRGFADLPEETRWGLVQVVHELYTGGVAPAVLPQARAGEP